MFEFLDRLTFYYPNKCKQIISKYEGNKHMRILRALSDRKLSLSDIKWYCSSGSSGYPPDQEYLLINQLLRENYEIQRLSSGSCRSVLREVELRIVNGNGTIIEHFEAC